MVRYPYILEMWKEAEAVLNDDGSWTEGKARWCYVCRCNARRGGSALERSGVDGKAFVYSYEVIMPATAPTIPLGTKIRILDRHEANILENAPCQCEQGQNTYRVKGFDRSGQRFQNVRLWV